MKNPNYFPLRKGSAAKPRNSSKGTLGYSLIKLAFSALIAAFITFGLLGVVIGELLAYHYLPLWAFLCINLFFVALIIVFQSLED